MEAIAHIWYGMCFGCGRIYRCPDGILSCCQDYATLINKKTLKPYVLSKKPKITELSKFEKYIKVKRGNFGPNDLEL
jgi:hypothetical protein